MINKILKITLATALLIFTSLSFAAPSLSNLHMVKNQLPPKPNAAPNQTKALTASAGHYYPTEISIVNNVPYLVYITIPGTDVIHDEFIPNDKVIFWSQDDFDCIRVILYDFYNDIFFDGYVYNYETLYTADFYYNLAAKRAAKAKAAH